VHTLRAASMLALFSAKVFNRPWRSLKACPSSHTSCKPVINNQAGLQLLSTISIMTKGRVGLLGCRAGPVLNVHYVLLVSMSHAAVKAAWLIPPSRICMQVVKAYMLQRFEDACCEGSSSIMPHGYRHFPALTMPDNFRSRLCHVAYA